MPKYLMIAQSNAKPGREEEYLQWYDNQHLKDVCAIPGVKSGHRYDVVPELFIGQPGSRFLAVYEINADDPADVLAALQRRSANGEIPMTEAIDDKSANLWLYKAAE